MLTFQTILPPPFSHTKMYRFILRWRQTFTDKIKLRIWIMWPNSKLIRFYCKLRECLCYMYIHNSLVKRSVMVTQEMCPIREEISTHNNLGKCIYLLFVWLAVIGFRQNYFYILPNFGDFGAKISFFHYIINQKWNSFIKHCSPPRVPRSRWYQICVSI